MGILKDKPESVKLDFAKIKLADLEYFCASKHIDEAVMRGLKLDWDQAIADEMEKQVKFYFVCLKNREYDMIASPRFDKWLANQGIDKVENMPTKYTAPSAKANACLAHFVNFLISEHKIALAKGDKKIAQKLPGLRADKTLLN